MKYPSDKASVMACAASLYTEGRKIDGIHNEFRDGGMGFLKCCLEVAEIFEAWACAHIDFESMDIAFPYHMESEFGEKFFSMFGASEMQGLTDEMCEMIAAAMSLPRQQDGQ